MADNRITKTESLTIRLTPELRLLLDEAQASSPYSPSITKIIERGIILSLRELKAMAAVLPERDIKK